jgi:ribose-phosphate pyrophosphokinase
MSLKILSGSANPTVAEEIAGKLDVKLTARTLERFSDGELHIEIQESVRGHDVYLVQPTCPPVDENLLELLLLADACRRAGAVRLTAVMPYFGYARQDRRSRGREPVGVRVVADLIQTSGIGRLVAMDLHSRAVESAFAMPLEHLSAVDILAQGLRPCVRDNSVIVSPDLGAVKMAERYATLLGLPVAIIHKTRITGEQVKVQRIVGDVRDKEVIIIDDMISTGGTIEEAVKALLEAGCSSARVNVVATHGLFVGAAAAGLAKLPIDRLCVSDSVPAPQDFPVPIEIFSLAPLLAETIRRLHRQEPLADLVH